MSAPDLDTLHRDLRRRYWHPDNDGIPLPPKPTPYRPRKDWRTSLDARITRCPGCDGWCWDGACACGPSGVSVQVSGTIEPPSEQDGPRRYERRGPGHEAREGALMTYARSYPCRAC